MNRLLTALLTTGLMAPYLLMLVALWTGPSKDSASSALAFASALVLGWLQRANLRVVCPRRIGFGMAGLSVATFCFVLSVMLSFRVGVGICAPVILASLLYLFRGWQAVSAFRVPILLLLLATPTPGFLMDRITYFLLDVLVLLLPALLAVLQIQVRLDGYTLAGSEWSVPIVEDCSGVGGIFLFIPLALLLLYAHPRVPAIGCAVVVAATLPIAFAGTVLRIVASCALGEMNSSLFESDPVHQAIGLFSLAGGLGLLLLLCRLFERSVNRPTGEAVA